MSLDPHQRLFSAPLKVLLAAIWLLTSPAYADALLSADQVEEAVAESVDDWFLTHGIKIPALDPHLIRAARENSERAARGALNRADLEFSLWRAGRPEPNVEPFVSVASDIATSRAAVLEFLERRRGRMYAMTHLGVGAEKDTHGRTVLTVILSHRVVKLAPYPLEASIGSWVRLAGWLEQDYRAPRVLYTAPDGRVRDARVTSQTERSFEALVPMHHGIGGYRMEVLAQGPRGPTVGALFSVYSGLPAPVVPVHRLYPSAPPASSLGDAQDLGLRLINRDRARFGLPPLRRHPGLRSAATAHSQHMLERGFFGHVAPDGKSPLSRVANAGVYAKRVLENVSVAQDLLRAHADLMNSPGHRRNILDPHVTHVGVGIARGVEAEQSVLFLTQTFAHLSRQRSR